MTDQPSTQEIRDKVQHLRDRLANEPQGDGFPPDGSVWLLDQVLALFDAPSSTTQEAEKALERLTEIPGEAKSCYDPECHWADNPGHTHREVRLHRESQETIRDLQLQHTKDREEIERLKAERDEAERQWALYAAGLKRAEEQS